MVTYSCPIKFKLYFLGHFQNRAKGRNPGPEIQIEGQGIVTLISTEWSQGSSKSAKWIRKLKFSEELCDTEVTTVNENANNLQEHTLPSPSS